MKAKQQWNTWSVYTEADDFMQVYALTQWTTLYRQLMQTWMYDEVHYLTLQFMQNGPRGFT